jgi:hypothetical protein
MISCKSRESNESSSKLEDVISFPLCEVEVVRALAYLSGTEITRFTYSRSKRHCGHLFVKSRQTLQFFKSHDGTSILDAVT